jgi:hypothetical protein
MQQVSISTQHLSFFQNHQKLLVRAADPQFLSSIEVRPCCCCRSISTASEISVPLTGKKRRYRYDDVLDFLEETFWPKPPYSLTTGMCSSLKDYYVMPTDPMYKRLRYIWND